MISVFDFKRLFGAGLCVRAATQAKRALIIVRMAQVAAGGGMDLAAQGSRAGGIGAQRKTSRSFAILRIPARQLRFRRGAAGRYHMHTAPVPCMPMASAAPRARSRLTPDTKGPRSLTTTITDFPVLGFDTVRRVPNGSVRWAAVMP